MLRIVPVALLCLAWCGTLPAQDADERERMVLANRQAQEMIKRLQSRVEELQKELAASRAQAARLQAQLVQMTDRARQSQAAGASADRPPAAMRPADVAPVGQPGPAPASPSARPRPPALDYDSLQAFIKALPMGFFDDGTTHLQAQKMAQAHVGKTIRLRGRVVSIHGSTDQIEVFLSAEATLPGRSTCQQIFWTSHFENRLANVLIDYRKGDEVTVEGELWLIGSKDSSPFFRTQNSRIATPAGTSRTGRPVAPSDR